MTNLKTVSLIGNLINKEIRDEMTAVFLKAGIDLVFFGEGEEEMEENAQTNPIEDVNQTEETRVHGHLLRPREERTSTD